MPNRICILDYATARVIISWLPDDVVTSEQVEKWLTDKGYRIDEIAYMTGDFELQM